MFGSQIKDLSYSTSSQFLFFIGVDMMMGWKCNVLSTRGANDNGHEWFLITPRSMKMALLDNSPQILARGHFSCLEVSDGGLASWIFLICQKFCLDPEPLIDQVSCYLLTKTHQKWVTNAWPIFTGIALKSSTTCKASRLHKEELSDSKAVSEFFPCCWKFLRSPDAEADFSRLSKVLAKCWCFRS